MKSLTFILCLFFGSFPLFGQFSTDSCDGKSLFWELGNEHDIYWNIATEKRLPHRGMFEMAGAKIIANIHYVVDQNKQLKLYRELTFPNSIAVSSKNNRFSEEGQPKIILDGIDIGKSPLVRAKIDGNLTFIHQPFQGISVQRKLFPSPSQKLFVEYWEIQNVGPVSRNLIFEQETFCGQPIGDAKNSCQIEVTSDVRPDITLHPNDLYRFAVYYTLKETGKAPPIKDAEFSIMERTAFLQEVGEQSVLVTPEPAFNLAFELAKISAAERALSTKSSQSSIKRLTDRIQDYPKWVAEESLYFSQALAILTELEATNPGPATVALKDFTCQSLFGRHTPEVPTTFHIPNSPENALYCQFFTKGLFGISTTDEEGVVRFKPRMPSGWKEMELQELKLYDTRVSLRLSKSRRYRGMYYFSVMKGGVVLMRKRIQAGRSVKVYVGGGR